jgi:hypothetical protein
MATNILDETFPNLDNRISNYSLWKDPEFGIHTIYYLPEDKIVDILDGGNLHDRLVEYLVKNGAEIEIRPI